MWSLISHTIILFIVGTILSLAGILAVLHKVTEGTTFIDPMYHERHQQAHDAGLLWGAFPSARLGQRSPRCSTSSTPWRPPPRTS